jgi:protein-S-isoprenylcysteine O-methyltransferase Ste14
METQTKTRPPAADPARRTLLLTSTRNGLISAVVLGLLLCLLAGTLGYWQGWVYAALFACLTTAQGVYLAIKDPALLERRKNIAAAGESKAERIFIIVGLVSNLGLLAFAALDHRFGWSRVPAWVSLAGDALLSLSFYLYYLVFRENSYAASSIQTFEGQTVVATGLYALVRHPKYLGDLLLVIGSPLALGSWWALGFVLIAVAGLAWRIGDEEKLLKQALPGYLEYTRQVRYHLVPYVW